MRKISTASLWLTALLCASVALAFVVIDDTHDQTVGGTKTHVFPDIGQVTFATLNVNVPADGQMQYCTDCQRNTEPCLGGGSGAMAIRRAGFWECLPGGGTCEITPTPLTFGTPGVIPVFNATELGSYAGATCPTPGTTPQAVTGISSSGALTCAVFGGGGGTPLPTATPVPTDTPLIDLLYSGKLNLGANASGTPLGAVAITADATPAPHDRVIYCNSSLSTPTPVIYTMPPATGTGRTIDMISHGTGYCRMYSGSDFMNDGHFEDFTVKWGSDTCWDVPGTTGQWACRNMPAPTPTP